MKKSKDTMQIHAYPSDHVYPFRTSWWDILNERVSFDAVIHTIALTNQSSHRLAIETLTIEAYAADTPISRQILQKHELQTIAEPIIGRVKAGLGRTLDLVIFMDQTLPAGVEPSSNPDLDPNTALVLPNLYLTFHALPDTLELIAEATNQDGATVFSAIMLNVIEYQSKNQYVLPIEGIWFMKAYPETGRLDHHRFGVSNEFGVDFLKLGPEGALFENDGRLAGDWYSHGEKVLAAADGKVVAMHVSSIQEWTRFNPREGETEDAFQERQLSEVHEALAGDVLDWAAGNYIVIEHPGGEFSSYLHLKEGSVRVKVGDQVARGDHIAEVGNTGDSYGAHLHFQITDSEDLITGRSLPFAFADMKVDLEEPGIFVRSAPQVD
jgi:murein DD-endopeptidase MepM/ murein hydrolase activator NlpD